MIPGRAGSYSVHEGRLRLVCEANPLAFIAERAGGAATTGTRAILGLVPLAIGSRVDVEEFGATQRPPAAPGA